MLHKHLLNFTRKYNKEFAIKGYSKLRKAELQQKIESVLDKQRTEIKEEYKQLKEMKKETAVKKETKKKPDHLRIQELMKKYNYKSLNEIPSPYNSKKLEKLYKEQKDFRDKRSKLPLREKISPENQRIEKELKKKIDEEKKYLRKNPQKLSKEKQELYDLTMKIQMN